ncbi:MAG: aminotransferase class V-fold PLP-dependent enzyme [Chlamydiales bacterium]|nr:aminotransferase class V-fold PLP-dependent enzyme [Chlamydiales bacterium]
MKRSAYLDNQTLSPPFPSVKERALSFQKEMWEAPHHGQPISALLASVYKKESQNICLRLGAAADDQFVFASSGEVAIQRLLLAVYLEVARETGRNHFLFAPGDLSEASGAKHLQKLGCTLKTTSLDSRGLLTPEALEAAIGPRTALVSLSWAHPFTGVIQPALDLSEVCKRKGVLLHLDASAVLGKLFFRFQDLQADFLTFEGRSLHAPEAAGLLLKKGVFASAIRDSDEESFAASIAALSHSQELLYDSIDHVCLETARLRAKLEEELARHLPDVAPLFSQSDRVPHISAIAFPGAHKEALLSLLQKDGIHAALGSPLLGELFQSSGVESSLAHTTLSFALSHETTEEQIDYALEKIVAAVRKLRTYSSKLISDYATAQ